MKKAFLIAAVAALTTLSAQAAEIGVGVSHFNGAQQYNAVGVSVTSQHGGATVTNTLLRADTDSTEMYQVSAVANYELAKISTASVLAKAGVAYSSFEHKGNGFSSLIGLGVSVPLTNTVSAEVDVVRQFNQTRVLQPNANVVTAGLKYKF